MTNSAIRGCADIVADPAHLAVHVAGWFVERVATTSGPVRVALCGGSTPRAFYTLLGSEDYRTKVAWERVHLFFGDERFVPHDDAASNFRMVRETLLAHGAVPPANIHPIPVTGTPQDAARAYAQTLQRIYGADVLDPARPLFDINFLGLGDDGHTASLLPGQPVLNEREHWAAAVMKGRDEPRITLTYPALEASRTIAFVVSGAQKAAAVRAARSGDETLPAGRLKPKGEVIWFLDEAAGAARTRSED